MEHSDYQPSTLVALGIVVAIGVSFLAVRVLSDATSIASDEATPSRLKRVYWCFILIIGVTVVAAAVVSAASMTSMSQLELGGYGMAAGMFVAITVWIALPIAVYNSLRVWRLPAVRLLWLFTALLASAFAFLANTAGDKWLFVALPVYWVATSVLAVRGLVSLRRLSRPG